MSCPVITSVLYVKCLCELSRYHSPVVEVLLYVKCLCELSLSQPSYMLNVCVSCPVVTAQW